MIDPAPLPTAGLTFAALAYAMVALTLAIQAMARSRIRGLSLAAPLVGVALPALGAGLLADHPWMVVPPLAVAVILGLLAARHLSAFTAVGQAFLVAHVQLVGWGLVWGAWFVLTIPVSPITRGLLEQWEVLLRREWRRPRDARPLAPGARTPRVCIHVPTHAEPPAVVIATLDALARLDYPNHEVVVIDNNTTDPALWRPVEEHCRRLGPRFRFFHLERWPGAKAGALNFALAQTPPDVEIIGLVDADYLANPRWLADLVGHFADPRISFVQPPHDYRGWEGRPFLRWCYWEYRVFFRTTMVALNERDAGITVGTMSLIRREALDRAGGWAEWCATEDSELAIRLHALGYSGIYTTTSHGRGLIPETFGGYAKQRFRWTAGPVQELKRHWRLYLPSPLATTSALTPVQKLHHLNHGLDRLVIGLNLLLVPLGAAALLSMLLQDEMVAIPTALWLAATALLGTGPLLQWAAYRAAVGCGWRDGFGASVASAALSHTIATASLVALAARRIPWRRTDKFTVLPLGLGALGEARTELSLATGLLAASAAGIAARPEPGLHLLLLIGGLLQGMTYLAAPTLALLADRDLREPRAESTRPERLPLPMGCDGD
jgi:hypothetical protein